MSWRPNDNGSYYSYAGYPNGAFATNFANEVTWSCWARFITGVTGGDEWIFGNGLYNFSRQGGSNTVYSHVTQGGSHSFLNHSAIGADPTRWHHLLGVWNRPATFDHQFAIDGGATGTGTTLVNGGGFAPPLLTYDSNIEIAHCAVWQGGFSVAEQQIAWKFDPLMFKPQQLRAYWPLSRGAGMRQVAPRSPDGGDDFMFTSVIGTRAIVTDDGPPIAENWPRLERMRVSAEGLIASVSDFVPGAVFV